MASKSKRRKARVTRQRRARANAPVFDVHARSIVESMAQMDNLVYSFAQAEDPVADIETAYKTAVDAFAAKVAPFNPFQLIEVARIASLPGAPAGHVAVTADAGAARVELLAAIALAARPGSESDCYATQEPQALSKFVSEASPELDDLIRLAHLRNIAAADPTDKMTMIALLVRGNEVWMRNSSYPQMGEATVRQLFDDQPDVRNELIAGVGFDGTDALAVLNTVDKLQQEALNDRFCAMFEAVAGAMGSVIDGELDPEVRDATRVVFDAAWEPDEDAVTVGIDVLVAESGIQEDRVRALIERFRFDTTRTTPAGVVDGFTAGNNPWRSRPLAVTDSGRVMLPHNALTVDAVRQNLEEYLKGSPAWNAYAKHRGDLLETRASDALGKVLPGATFRDGFEYYIPNNQAELDAGDPAKYTKRVEGDHLVVLDDVALVVEDKAVAFSALSRGGKVNRIRTDLTGIVTKAAEQAGRLRDAIKRDAGVRIEGEGWVDLSHIREVHTIAVSLDDLSSVTTATAELVRAGLLDADNIPWTVSLHDLELIVELIDRPAEFLLYLQRRRNPEVTNMFAAADELDLFLYFFEAGLWVEPDPDQVRVAFPFLPEPTTAERRRYREQRPAFITSRTDPLDRWFYSRDAGDGETVDMSGGGSSGAPKPRMVTSPLADVIDELEARRVRGWLSIGATLLGQATAAQHKTAGDVRTLLDNPTGDHVGRSITVPVAGSTVPEEGWLLVWATLPAGLYRAAEEERLREYLQAKKHQLSLPRGALFLYDETTRDLVDVLFDDHVGPLPPEVEAKLGFLRPATSMTGRQHPNGRKTPTDSGPRRARR